MKDDSKTLGDRWGFWLMSTVVMVAIVWVLVLVGQPFFGMARSITKAAAYGAGGSELKLRESCENIKGCVIREIRYESGEPAGGRSWGEITRYQLVIHANVPADRRRQFVEAVRAAYPPDAEQLLRVSY